MKSFAYDPYIPADKIKADRQRVGVVVRDESAELWKRQEHDTCSNVDCLFGKRARNPRRSGSCSCICIDLSVAENFDKWLRAV